MSMFLVGAGISANNVDARDAVVVSTAVGTTADRLLGRAHHRVAHLPVLNTASGRRRRITPSLAKGSFIHRVGAATFLVRDLETGVKFFWLLSGWRRTRSLNLKRRV
mgnify:CR=1 FL=1